MTPEAFFDGTRNASLLSFLIDRPPGDCIATDAPTFEFLEPHIAARDARPALVDLERSEARALARLPDSRRIFVCSPTAEAEWIARTERTLGDDQRPVFGLVRDVYPVLTARTDLMNRYDPEIWRNQDPEPTSSSNADDCRRYAIVCTPRSGSHWLCDMLMG